MNSEIDQPTLRPQSSLITQLSYLLRATRPKQWVKNVFVFGGIVFAETHLLTEIWALTRVGIAFFLFSVISSSVYLINDLSDVEKDRLHPQKRLRPLASGQLSPQLATIVAILLPLSCIALITLLAASSPDSGWLWFGLVLLLYFVLQLAYTFVLKHYVLVDLFAITAGFVLRAVAGAAVLSIYTTGWWLLSVFFLALFLGLGKRRNEIQLLAAEAGEHRRVLQDYSLVFLDYLLLIDTACTILVYSQATYTAPLARHMPYPFLVLTVPLVVFALFRYLYLIIQKNQGGEPADLLLRDRPLQLVIATWGLMVLVIQIMRF